MMKLISICPSNTELLGYLRLTSSLVGVDNYSDWPEDVQSLPRLGSDLNIDMDKVEELQPDLVLASLSVPGMERNIEELEKRKIPYVIVPNPKSLTEVGESLLFVGEATNTSDKAKQLFKKYTLILDRGRGAGCGSVALLGDPPTCARSTRILPRSGSRRNPRSTARTSSSPRGCATRSAQLQEERGRREQTWKAGEMDVLSEITEEESPRSCPCGRWWTSRSSSSSRRRRRSCSAWRMSSTGGSSARRRRLARSRCAMRRTRRRLQIPAAPVRLFFFLGPTGVGKTELPRPSPSSCSATSTPSSGSTCRSSTTRHGVAPDRVTARVRRRGEGGQLTAAVRRKPFAVVLFDEIEKAHPNVFDPLLQILEDGHASVPWFGCSPGRCCPRTGPAAVRHRWRRRRTGCPSSLPIDRCCPANGRGDAGPRSAVAGIDDVAFLDNARRSRRPHAIAVADRSRDAAGR